MDDIENNISSVTHLLATVFSKDSNRPLRQHSSSLERMNGMYLQQFSKHFPIIQQHYRSKTTPVEALLAVLIATDAPLTVQMLKNMIRNVGNALERASSILISDDSMSDLKRTVHLKHRASLKTFLCNKQISSDYFIRSDLGLKLLATYKLRHVHALGLSLNASKVVTVKSNDGLNLDTTSSNGEGKWTLVGKGRLVFELFENDSRPTEMKTIYSPITFSNMEYNNFQCSLIFAKFVRCTFGKIWAISFLFYFLLTCIDFHALKKYV